MAQPVGDTETVEVIALLQVVAGVVRCHPVRNGIDVQLHFLRGLCLPYEHLARRNEAADKAQLGIVQMERLPVHFSVHLRVGQKDFRRATLGHSRQHSRFLKFLDGLRRQDHGGVVLAPGLLCLHHVVADRLVLDEEPRLVEQEDLEGGEFLRVGNFIRRAVQNVKQQRFQDLGCIVPAVEVAGLKARERQRVLGVVEEEAVLATACPAMQAFLQFTNDVRKVRDGALGRLQHVHALDGIPQAALFFEVEPVTLLVPLNEHAEEAEEKLQVFLGLRKRERIDGEVPRLLAGIQIRSAEDGRKRLKAAANFEDEGERRVLLCVLQQEIAKIRFATPYHPENQRVGNLAVMQVQEIGRAVVRFEDSQVLGAEMGVRLVAGKDRKEKRQVGVVRVQQIQLAQVERIVTRYGGEIGV